MTGPLALVTEPPAPPSRDTEATLSAAYAELVSSQMDTPRRAIRSAAANIGKRLAESGAPLEAVARVHDCALRNLAQQRVFFPPVDLVAASTIPLVEMCRAYSMATNPAEIARREELERYRRCLELVPHLVLVFSDTGFIAFANRDVPGMPRETLVGCSIFGALGPDGAEALRAAMQRVRPGSETQPLKMGRGGTGTGALPLEGTIQSLGDPQRRWFVLTTRDPADTLEASRRLARAMADLESSQRLLRQAQKMEALGRLAGGVAHDFNNLLTAIVSCAQFVLDDLDDEDPHREDLSEIVSAANSAAQLTGQLLSFSRKRPVRKQHVEVGAAIRRMAKMLRRTLGERVELVMLLASEELFVEVDPGQFEQVLLNLAVNAYDAMPTGGTLTIQLSSGRGFAPPLDSTDCVFITVSDTGPGIPRDLREQVFEPFFSTKGEGGNGLGLATSYGIITQAGGELGIDDTSIGATFRISLPRLSVPTLSPMPPAKSTLASSSLEAGSTVLVVEDQPAILRTMDRTLTRAGMRVQAARSAAECLALVESLDLPPVLLVADVVLPGTSGIELAASLRQRFPKLRVLLTSGYMGDEYAFMPAPGEATMFLPKPFTGNELMEKVGALARSDSYIDRGAVVEP